MEVAWSRAAEVDLRQIRAYLARENANAAMAVASAITAVGNRLGEFPFKGHAGNDGTREWVVPRFPRYLLIDDIDLVAEVVTVLRVWHQSRDR